MIEWEYCPYQTWIFQFMSQIGTLSNIFWDICYQRPEKHHFDAWSDFQANQFYKVWYLDFGVQICIEFGPKFEVLLLTVNLWFYSPWTTSCSLDNSHATGMVGFNFWSTPDSSLKNLNFTFQRSTLMWFRKSKRLSKYWFSGSLITNIPWYFAFYLIRAPELKAANL